MAAPTIVSERVGNVEHDAIACSTQAIGPDRVDHAIRILHVLEPLIAGVPSYVDALGRALAVRDVEQHVLTAAPTSGSGSWPFGDWATTVTRRPWPRRPESAFRIAKELRRLVTLHDVQLLHVHATFAGMAARVRRLDLPVLYQPHGWGHLSAPNRAGAAAARFVERRLDRRTNVLLTLSRHEVSAAPRGRTCTPVRPIVNLDGFHPLGDAERELARSSYGWSSDERIHLCVGELSYRKNQVALAECWLEIAPVGNRLVLVGDGKERARVGRCEGNRVQVMGWRRDIARLMGAADTLVVASRGEGFSLVLLEALATGLPVFSTDVGGSEIVADDAGKVCRTVEEVVTAAVTTALRVAPSERARRAERTHREWSVDTIADEFLAVYRTALDTRSTRTCDGDIPSAPPFSPPNLDAQPVRRPQREHST